MTELDLDFEQVAAKINAKLKEAAEAIREANRLADQAKLPGLIFTQFMADDIMDHTYGKEKESRKAQVEELVAKFNFIKVRDLEIELGQAGWSTSSSYC